MKVYLVESQPNCFLRCLATLAWTALISSTHARPARPATSSAHVLHTEGSMTSDHHGLPSGHLSRSISVSADPVRIDEAETDPPRGLRIAGERPGGNWRELSKGFHRVISCNI